MAKYGAKEGPVQESRSAAAIVSPNSFNERNGMPLKATASNSEYLSFVVYVRLVYWLNFRRRIKSRLPFAAIIRLPYSTCFQDKG